MLDRLRSGVGNAFAILAERFTADPRFPQHHRVPYSPRTLAGVVITPDTAIQVATVWACLRFLSQTVAQLPWHVKKEGDHGPTTQLSHPVDYLLWKRPNPEWSSFQFRETLAHWALRWGNGYAEIERDQLDRPFALWPLHPDRTWPWRATEEMVSAKGRPIAPGELYYRVSNTNTSDYSSAGSVIIAAKDMFHIRGFGEGPVGVNLLEYAAQSIGWARAAQLFGATFFGNGMNISGVVVNKKPLKPDGLKRQKAEFEQLYRGPRNANRTAFLDNDADWKPLAVDPKNAQLLELHQFLVEEICRWFGVPPHKVAHLQRTTYTNIESQGIEVVVDSITPWVKRFEDEAEWKLFGQNRQGYYTMIDMRGLMRGDAAARMAYIKGMRETGGFSINDALRFEDLNTIGADGDVRTMNGAYRTLDQIIEGQGLPGVAPGGEGAEGDDDEIAAVPDPGEDAVTYSQREARIEALEKKRIAACLTP